MEQNNTTKGVKGFSEAFYSLPANMIQGVKQTIRDNTGWALSTFYSKCNGTRKLKPLELAMLQDLFKGFGIDF